MVLTGQYAGQKGYVIWTFPGNDLTGVQLTNGRRMVFACSNVLRDEFRTKLKKALVTESGDG